MRSSRQAAVIMVLLALAAGIVPAQKKKPAADDEGYIPQVLPEGKQKKEKEQNQAPPPSRTLPNAIAVDTDRLTFNVSPLSAKGLLSQQTRDALKALIRSSHGTIVKLRAFVSGSGDLRRIGELTAETFSEKHLPFPVLSVVQVGALPLEGAQVLIEATEVDKKSVNPNGVAFLSGQSAPSVTQSLEQLKNALHGAELDASDAMRVTCFVSSIADQKDTRDLMGASFPGAVLNFVQMQREPVSPAAECEAVARLRTPVPQGIDFLNPPNLAKSVHYSQISRVTSPRLVITGTQLAFGNQESDLKLAFERLDRALTASNARVDRAVMVHMYLTSGAIMEKVRAVRGSYFAGKTPPASTMLPFEGLPSLDAQAGVDVVAVPDSSDARR